MALSDWPFFSDLLNIKKYGLIAHLRYLFNYDKTVVFAQVDLTRLMDLPDMTPYSVRELDFNCEHDLATWAHIINVAYEEEQYDVAQAKKKLQQHEYLNVRKVYLLYDGERCIGTVSSANFKSNPKIASGCRFAVLQEYRGKGIGKLLYLMIMHALRKEGFSQLESTMAIKREASFILKFKLGFYPQFNRKYVQFKSQRRFFVVRWIADYHLYRLWRNHLATVNKKYLLANQSQSVK
jgi:GNAT superfamily N-acetyltransferase